MVSAAGAPGASTEQRRSWPALRRFEGADRRAISLPLGGIGTGTIGLGGRGELRDWELQNHPAKGSYVAGSFFAVRAAVSGHPPSARLLEGALYDEEYEGPLGSPTALAGLPRFERCSFETTYPFARVVLSDDAFPLEVALEAFNPLIPGDADASGRPVIVWRVVLRNTTADALETSVMCSVADFIGARLRAGGRDRSRPRIESRQADGVLGGLLGVLLAEDALAPDDEEWGSFAAAVIGPDSWRGPAWAPGKWNQGSLRMWSGFLERGVPGALRSGDEWEASVDGSAGAPAATIGATRKLEPLGTAEVGFVFGWHFPNRRSWAFTGPGPAGGPGDAIIGNWYCNGRADGWEALVGGLADIDELEDATLEFVEALTASDLSAAVKEAALFNLSTLRSPTYFRSADGMAWGFEGVLDHTGSCPGSCTHVWNYEMATPFLFGELARAMRENEYLHGTGDDGVMAFRIGLPAERMADWRVAAADGQFGCLVKLYREWQLSGDDEFLARLWPAARRSLEFAWEPGSWDADGDGVAEGCQHNTLDIEYFGPNPLIQGWYLVALRAAGRMAEQMGEGELAKRCAELEASGAAFTERELFNGEYYEQQVRAPGDFSRVHPLTRLRVLGALDASDPEFQIGSGCLIDQLAGQVAGELAGLGPIFSPEHARRSLESVHRYNYVGRFSRWTNYMRPYVLGEDRGHVMVAYPRGVPEHPVPYWCEVMTGFEYTYALALVQAGLTALAEDVVASIRERYDGRRRNPFDEAECGHHYARAMASWGLVNAFAGFSYSAVEQRIAFGAASAGTRFLWATGSSWGVLAHGASGADRRRARLEVRRGSIRLRAVEIGGSLAELEPAREVNAGEALELDLEVLGP